MRRWIRASFLFAALLCTASPAQAVRNIDAITFTPANDGGRYIRSYQSQTLQQLRFNLGAYFNYAFEPFELADLTGARVSGIVDDLIVADAGAAIGITDWWQIGGNFPMALWQTFREPNRTAANFGVKQTFYGKLVDPRFDMKFRLLDIDRHRVGLALVPYVYFPLGKEEYFLGNGMFSPGGDVVFDVDIKNRVFMTLNAGYRNYRFVRYDTTNTNAVLDDTINLGGGINVRLTDWVALIGEAWHEGVYRGYFKNQIQNPAEFLVAGRFTPKTGLRGLGMTVGAGRAFTTGVGSPEFRVLAGINYRTPAVVSLPPPVEVEAVVEEKIVITQKIHFEFDRAVIRDVSRPIVDDVAMLLQANAQIRRVRIEGHTDWIGSDAYNQRLSERRAYAVRDYLISRGVAADRLEAVGYGEARPIADNNTVKGRARNRRTEFTVLEVGN